MLPLVGCDAIDSQCTTQDTVQYAAAVAVADKATIERLSGVKAPFLGGVYAQISSPVHEKKLADGTYVCSATLTATSPEHRFSPVQRKVYYRLEPNSNGGYLFSFD